jgi:acyl transferase domain-containing protein/acyl-CoA synthetase (AMP-forming)/AMP-acid ligase II/pimeloyl-ACP methyl ester carboxylesterase/acyl carrier protein
MLGNFSTFVDLLNYRAEQQPDKVAFYFIADEETELGRLTYRDLDRQAQLIATMLASFQSKGERALLLYQPGLEFIGTFVGCLYAGVIPVPAYPPRANRSLDRLQAIVDDAQAQFALTTQSLIGSIAGRFTNNFSAEAIHCLTTDNLEITPDWQKPDIDSSDLAFLQYTSGSTGAPKGVMVSHANILHNSYLINRCFEDTTESRGVSWLPPYHDMGLIGGILQPLYVGASMALLSPVTFLQRPHLWLKAITKYRATTSGGPNFAYDLCINQITPEQKATLDLSSWELAFSGAEPVRAKTIEEFVATFAECGFRREAFYPCYGMAETTLIVSGGQKKAPPIVQTISQKGLEEKQVILSDSSGEDSYDLVGCGKTIDNQKIIIVNPDTLNRCKSDEIGEIWVAGPSIAGGYWQKEEQTIATFQAHTADTNEGLFLRTGDLGFLKDGELFVTGRLKDLIIIRGRNYYPQDIELTVDRSHPALREGCGAAFAVEVGGEEKLVVVQEIKRSYLRNLNAEEVTKAIRKAISEERELQPHAILLLKTGTIPKTSSGKIRRHACRQGFLDRTLDVVGESSEAQTNLTPNPSPTRRGGQGEEGKERRARRGETHNKQREIQNWLVDRIAEKVGIDPGQIDVREPFASSGLDSVQAVRLSAELEDWLRCKIAPTIVYDYPNIASLSEYLATLGTQTPKLTTSPPTPLLQGEGRLITNEEIAIVGIGCRFPGAKNVREFWQLLREGKESIDTSKNRFNNDDWGGFLQNIDKFDAQFFGISAREAQRMDPQQRLLLEVCWEALEYGNIAADKLAGSNTGVFIGISSNDYSRLQSSEDADIYAGTGNAYSIAANRLSYFLDLRGPSLTIDTACSSSLVAVHLAAASLKNGECNSAIVGGVNLILAPEITQSFSLAGMMAADGKCKTFDRDADGYVRGEGCGVVILKRRSDAEKDGDNILALVKGSAINQDGKSNGLTAPNGLAQQSVVSQALINAGTTAADISYIEAHGTGTELGDPIEVNSLKAVNRDRFFPCWLGSVKTNIGHLEAAAGIAGLIKVVLSLQNEEIPPHLNFHELNPHIDLENLFAIPTQIQAWPRGEKPRLAGVSSFGFGGTNAHAILAETVGGQKEKGKRQKEERERSLNLLTLSAKSEKALRDLVQKYREFLTENNNIADVCFTANTGRSHFSHRLAVSAETNQQLQELLQAFSEGNKPAGLISDRAYLQNNSKIAFLFTGQGSQYINMGQQLYQTQPVFRATIDRCAEILKSYLEIDLLEILYPKQHLTPNPSPARRGENNQQQTTKIDETAHTQPALFALEYALAMMWQAWDVRPSLVMGHSVGEYVAATIAGVFSLEDGLKLIAERAKLMQALPEGKMVAVFSRQETIAGIIRPFEERVSIAALNGQRNIVISGETEAIEEVLAIFKKQRIKSKTLKVSHAFHSPLMKPMLAEFAKVASEISYSTAKIDIISNLTGTIATEAISTPDYWIDHVLAPVQFLDSMKTLQASDCQIFLEIGSQPILLGMGRQCLPESDRLWLPSLRPEKPDWQQITSSLSELYVRGVTIDWLEFDRAYQRQKVVGLPTYPFQRQSYWLPKTDGRRKQTETKIANTERNWLYRVDWQVKNRNYGFYDSNKANLAGKWLILSDRTGVGEKISQELEKQGHKSLLVYHSDFISKPHPQPLSYKERGVNGEGFEEENNTLTINPTNSEDWQKLFSQLQQQDLKGIIHLWSLDAANSAELNSENLEEATALGCGSVLNLIQTLLRGNAEEKAEQLKSSELPINPKLWLVTQESQAIEPNDNLQGLSRSSLWGLGKVIALEHPEIWGGILDLGGEIGHSSNFQISSLVGEILDPEAEDQIALRNGQRYVARLVKICRGATLAPKNLAPNKKFTLKSEATYLITGGLGSLGLKVASWLVEKGAKNLVLLSRSGFKEDSAEILQQLEEAGAKVRIAQADVAKESDLATVFAEIKDSLPPLRGIIHAAGVLDDGILAGQSWQSFSKVMSPKVRGTWNLHKLTQELPLDFLVMFSSVASLFGSPGQGNYAAANAFMDAIASYRTGLGLPALSINWGPFAEGMATSTRLAVRGLNPIATAEGLEIFLQLLQDNPVQVGVVSVQWEILQRQFPDLLRSPYFSAVSQELVKQERQTTTGKQEIFDRLLVMSPDKRESFLSDYLQTSIANILQINPQEVSPSENLPDLGLDSLMVMETINQLKGDLRLMLYPREFYERPKIIQLAKYLATEFDRSHGKNKAIQLPEKTNKLPGIVFILSSPRSGSTLLRVMLEGHPQLCSPPELHLLPFATMGEREQKLGLSGLGEGLQRALMQLKGIDARESQELVGDLVKKDVSVPEVYQMLQQLAPGRLLVDKSPTYASSKETLARSETIFSNAKYIHLVRHPYAVIESFSRMRMDKLVGTGSENPEELAESIWTDSNQNVLEFAAQLKPEQYCQVKYEDLVTQPERVMENLCEFLGIEFDRSVLNPYQGDRMTDGVYNTSMSVGDPNFSNHKQIDAQLADTWKQIKLSHQLNPTTRSIADRFNYQLPNDPVGAGEPLPYHPSDLEQQMSEHFIDVRGLKVCLCSWGPQSGPLVFCLHGILEQGASWLEVAVRLAQKGYRVVAPDLRGHGRSDRADKGGSYNLLDFLSDLDAIARELTNKPFTLVGHSLGSVIAAIFASIRPQKVKNLILVETVLPSETNEEDTAEQLANQLDYLASVSEHPVFPNVAAAAERLRLATPALSESLALKLADRITEPCEGGVRWCWSPLLKTRAGISFSGIGKSKYLGLLRRIKAPITLIYGDRSDFNREEDLQQQQEAMPDAKRVTLAGGHNLHLETPSALAEIIIS